jgi:uncharacterized protein YjiS (DUF1127 family)
MTTLPHHPSAIAQQTTPRLHGGRLARLVRQSAALAARVGAVMAAAHRARRQRAAMERQRRQIDALDGATLKDIGLHRSEAGSAAAELCGYAEASRRVRCADSVAPLY